MKKILRKKKEQGLTCVVYTVWWTSMEDSGSSFKGTKKKKMFSQIQPPTQPFIPVQPEPQEWYYIMGPGFETA